MFTFFIRQFLNGCLWNCVCVCVCIGGFRNEFLCMKCNCEEQIRLNYQRKSKVKLSQAGIGFAPFPGWKGDLWALCQTFINPAISIGVRVCVCMCVDSISVTSVTMVLGYNKLNSRSPGVLIAVAVLCPLTKTFMGWNSFHVFRYGSESCVF